MKLGYHHSIKTSVGMSSIDPKTLLCLLFFVKSIVINLDISIFDLWSVSQHIRVYKMTTFRLSLFPYVFLQKIFRSCILCVMF